MGADMLATALGLAEPVLAKMIQGHDAASLEYTAHIDHRLKEAGLPSAWLNQTNFNVRHELVNALRKLASSSANRAPTRRHNFQKLVDAFEGRTDALADALDMIETSIRGIADGRLPLDEERINHLNPRLMSAGFPIEWLDEAQSQVNPEWVSKLQALADESAELEHQEREDARKAERQASPPTSQTAQPAVAPAANAQAVTTPLTPPVAQQALFETPKPLGSQAASTPSPTKTAAKPPVLVSSAPVQNTSKENTMSATQSKPSLVPFSKANFAGASKPGAAPMLPRGVMSAGRAIGGAASAPGKKGPLAASIAKATAAPAASTKPKTRAQHPSRVQPPAPAPSAPMQDASSKPNTRGGKTPVTHETSQKRAEALEKLLETARRGAKVTLWRDLLGSSLPYWGNIRRGTVLMRDEMADEITKHMGLPAGWLDNPQFPPATLASWVTDASVTLPGAGTPAPGGQADSPAPAAARTSAPAPIPGNRPFARTQAPAPTATINQPSSAQAPAAAPEPQARLDLSPAARAAADNALAAANATGQFNWKPASNPQPLTAPGQMVQAVNMVLNQLSMAGHFTDQDAMRFLAMLTATR